MKVFSNFFPKFIYFFIICFFVYNIYLLLTTQTMIIQLLVAPALIYIIVKNLYGFVNAFKFKMNKDYSDLDLSLTHNFLSKLCTLTGSMILCDIKLLCAILLIAFFQKFKK